MIMEFFLDQFEHICEDRPVVGPADVWQFMATLPEEPLSDPEFVLELSRVALELSWMRWPERLKQLSSKLDPNDLIEKLASVPRARDFFSLLKTKGVSPSHYNELVESEYRLRSTHGDNMPAEYFAMEYGTIVTSQKFEKTKTVTSDFRNSYLKAELQGLCSFGRQRSADPDDLQVEQRPDGKRIIIAPRLENRVSRNQMSLQLLSHELAILHNTSSTNKLRIAPHELLGIGEKKLIRFPFVIIFPHQRFSFQ